MIHEHIRLFAIAIAILLGLGCSRDHSNSSFETYRPTVFECEQLVLEVPSEWRVHEADGECPAVTLMSPDSTIPSRYSASVIRLEALPAEADVNLDGISSQNWIRIFNSGRSDSVDPHGASTQFQTLVEICEHRVLVTIVSPGLHVEVPAMSLRPLRLLREGDTTLSDRPSIKRETKGVKPI